MKQVKKVFVYLTIISVSLAIISLSFISQNFSGKVVLTNQNPYLLTEVQAHNSLGDCWIISNNEIYDITVFLNIYPQYVELRDKCGKDASIITSSLSQDTLSIISNYKIGVLR